MPLPYTILSGTGTVSVINDEHGPRGSSRCNKLRKFLEPACEVARSTRKLVQNHLDSE
ncbi:unnamed protein product [Sphenostylis stenocarpa]|uniref:Uncharacterized protein n=1 Tax=Sphenostylis stenocarpa TaxID=92480 RepID=A0AA86RQ31_9FABA|nr:unnamed protein product [Sphenostylis stenocarpa]